MDVELFLLKVKWLSIDGGWLTVHQDMSLAHEWLTIHQDMSLAHELCLLICRFQHMIDLVQDASQYCSFY